jgi:phage-related protein
MKVLEIRYERFRVGAIVKERSSGDLECELYDALEAVESTEESARNRLLNLLDLIARDGLTALNSSQFHLVDQKNGIYELIASRLRVLFFKAASGQLVICTHLFMKKGQKTPEEEKRKARNLKKRFEQEGADWIREYGNG